MATAREIHFQDGGSRHCGVTGSKDVSSILPLDVAVEEGEVTDKEASSNAGYDNQDVTVGWRLRRIVSSWSVILTSRTVRSGWSGLSGLLDIVRGVLAVTLLIGGQDVEVVGGGALEVVHGEFCTALEN